MIQFHDVRAGRIDTSFALPAAARAKIVVTSIDIKDHFTGVLLGRKRPDSGVVQLFGADLYALTEPQRISLFARVGAVPESGGLISNLKGWENALLPAAYHDNKAEVDVEARVTELAMRLGLSRAALARIMSVLPDAMSLFERRVIAMVRALLLDADVMIYDFLLSDITREDALRLLSLSVEAHDIRPDRLSIYVCPDDALSARVAADITIHLEDT